MGPKMSVAVTLLISAACIVGDYYLKIASNSPKPFRTMPFAIGVAVFAATSVGWVYVLRHLKLGAVGVVYGVSTVLFMALLGRVAFGETFRWYEVTGVLLGVASIVLLARFA
jgi:drug/metabolite transporter (DMT)-like permease